jgi:hypothetical protein
MTCKDYPAQKFYWEIKSAPTLLMEKAPTNENQKLFRE